MRTKIRYVCEHCNSEYETSYHAEECEAKHLGLTISEYSEYKELLEKEREAFSTVSCRNNPATRQACDDAVAAVLEFQKKYGFTDNR